MTCRVWYSNLHSGSHNNHRVLGPEGGCSETECRPRGGNEIENVTTKFDKNMNTNNTKYTFLKSRNIICSK